MNFRRTYLSLIYLIVFISCHDSGNHEAEYSKENTLHETAVLIPIPYDFKNLNLHLNSSIYDNPNIEWRWDYMNSENAMPDSTGIDYYMNLSQPVFSFNGETSLPSISVQTDCDRIIQFSVTTIFHLESSDIANITALMDSLSTIDLFKNESVRQEIMQARHYKKRTDSFEEEITLELNQQFFCKLLQTIMSNFFDDVH